MDKDGSICYGGRDKETKFPIFLQKNEVNRHHYQAPNSSRSTVPLPVDFTGAPYIRQGRSESKVYICLFMCAAIRAVHLEVVSSSPFVDLPPTSFIRYVDS